MLDKQSISTGGICCGRGFRHQGLSSAVLAPVEGGLFHHFVLRGPVPAGNLDLRQHLRHGGLLLHHPVSAPPEGGQPAGGLRGHVPHVPAAVPAGLCRRPQCVAVRHPEFRRTLLPGVLEVQPVHPQGTHGLRHDLRLSGAASTHAGAATHSAGGGGLLLRTAGDRSAHQRQGNPHHQ